MMRLLLRAVAAAALVFGLSLTTAAGAPAHATSCGWESQQAAERGTFTELHGLAVVSATDVWAVGDYGGGLPSSPLHTMVEHWDGSRWSGVSSPNHGTHGSALEAVEFSSAVDGWAVGTARTSSGGTRILLEHWNGSAWVVATSPSVQGSATLEDVTADTASDVWAVGWRRTGQDETQPLILHWDGVVWQAVSSPTLSGNGGPLNGVAMASPTYGWAVGREDTSPVIEHWDGKAWTTVITPEPTPGYFQAMSPTHGWAVGTYNWPSTGQTALIYHWDGRNWRMIQSAPATYLYGVAAASKDDVWAVGIDLSASQSQSVIEHWDGSAWTADATVPHFGSSESANSVAADAVSGQAWVLGDYWDAVTGTSRPIILHHC